jgi:hypothetical protein
MLKAYQATAAFAAILFFLAMLGIAYYSSPRANDPSEEQATAEQNPRNQNREQSKVSPSFWSWLFPDSLSVFTLWLSISTIGLGIVAVIQLGFLSRQEGIAAAAAQAAKTSANVAERTLTELERPYIFVDIPKFVPSPIEGRPHNVQYVLKNYGRTPAIVRWLKASAKPEPPSTTGGFWMEVFNGQIVFKPGDEKEVEPLARMPTPYPTRDPVLRAIEEPIILLSIEITYSDVFDYIHVNEFTFFESRGSFHAIAGKKYNRSKSEKLLEGVEWTPAWSEKKRE